MVGMWTPEPSREPYDENLSTAEVGIVMAEQDSSDSEDENPVYGGYQPLTQVPTELPNSGNEDTDVSDLEQWFILMLEKRTGYFQFT
jgi:hypothetical protein